MTSKIEHLRAMPIYGNAHDDRQLLNLAHEIAIDDARPSDERIEALQRMDEAMGLTGDTPTWHDVEAYVAYCVEDGIINH